MKLVTDVLHVGLGASRNFIIRSKGGRGLRGMESGGGRYSRRSGLSGCVGPRSSGGGGRPGRSLHDGFWAEPGAADEAVAFFFAFLATAGGAGGDTAGGMSEPASRPATAGGEDERDIFFSENDEKPAESSPKGKKTSRKKEKAR